MLVSVFCESGTHTIQQDSFALRRRRERASAGCRREFVGSFRDWLKYVTRAFVMERCLLSDLFERVLLFPVTGNMESSTLFTVLSNDAVGELNLQRI